jgi:hypothetical protein
MNDLKLLLHFLFEGVSGGNRDSYACIGHIRNALNLESIELIIPLKERLIAVV